MIKKSNLKLFLMSLKSKEINTIALIKNLKKELEETRDIQKELLKYIND